MAYTGKSNIGPKKTVAKSPVKPPVKPKPTVPPQAKRAMSATSKSENSRAKASATRVAKAKKASQTAATKLYNTQNAVKKANVYGTKDYVDSKWGSADTRGLIAYRKGAAAVAKKNYRLAKAGKPAINPNAKGKPGFKVVTLKMKKLGSK